MKIFNIFWVFYKKLWVFEPRKHYFSLKGLMGRLNLIGNLYYVTILLFMETQKICKETIY